MIFYVQEETKEICRKVYARGSAAFADRSALVPEQGSSSRQADRGY